ncbi:MAG: hypothetical protein ABI167_05740 [Nitrosospira sp.]
MLLEQRLELTGAIQYRRSLTVVDRHELEFRRGKGYVVGGTEY